MGTIDEHWCTLCHKKLDKTKDKYLDFELIHQAAQPLIKKWKKPKGLVCMECIERDPKLKELVDTILKAGNPAFLCEVTCLSFNVCKTYQPTSKPNVNCGHISVTGDTVYCKRSHPGNVKLMVERAERARLEQQLVLRFFHRLFRSQPEPLRNALEQMFNQGVKGTWTPPSQIIKAVPVEEMKNTKVKEANDEGTTQN